MVVGLAGSFGCGSQQLGGGTPGGDGGNANCGPLGKITCAVTSCSGTTTMAPICVNGSWRCPAEPIPTIGCEPPICAASLPFGCTCDPSTGVTTCRDAGANDDSRDAAVRDAAATCTFGPPDGSIRYCVGKCSDPSPLLSSCDAGVWSCPLPGTMDQRACQRDAGVDAHPSCPPYGADGGLFACTYGCASDTGVAALCVDGAWQCPSGTFKESLCPPPRRDGG